MAEYCFQSDELCPCLEDTTTTTESVVPECVCPRDDHGIRVHEQSCMMYRNERMIYRKETDKCVCDAESGDTGDSICHCCRCPIDRCTCRKSGKEALEEWRKKPIVAAAFPSVLDANHPLMQKFQDNLRQFLEKENAIADEEILNLRDELRLKKESYDKDLEGIYRSDHDTNQQRVLIEEYEEELKKKHEERLAAEERAKKTGEKYKINKEKLEQDIINEREAQQEMEALTSLCKQLEKWRDDTESDLTISNRMSNKMKAEKRALAEEKRELDIFIYSLTSEIWKLESKLEMFRKQMEIKGMEMERVNDKVTSYAAELEDLDLDKRRLTCLWNSVLVNIHHRDNVYNSVREDYRDLQENYRTLLSNLSITKKITEEEMNKSKEISMNADKLMYDINSATKQYESEEARRLALEGKMIEITDSIEMTERDERLIKAENQVLSNTLRALIKDCEKQMEIKLNLENNILDNLQECLLNDKAVESMANGIKKMREWIRKEEIALLVIENNHAKVLLEIEVQKSKESRNKKRLEEIQEKVREKERIVDELDEKYQQGSLDMTRKQRELDMVKKKFDALKEIFDLKSPQERRIEDLENQIKGLREKTEQLQEQWLRMQGHVIKLSTQHQKIVADVNLINKQIQICDQKTARIQAEAEQIAAERARVDRNMRDLHGKLEVLERDRKDATERNQNAQRVTQAVTHEYSANLKDAEFEILQIEEDIDQNERDKVNLQQELDRVQREALIWQRKGILAVDLKKSMTEAKSAEGEIGQMRSEIHRMTVRREQLRKIAEKLSDDLAQCVTRREIVMDKSRAAAAIEKSNKNSQNTSQSQYKHKLRMAKADVARVTKDVNDAQAKLTMLQAEYDRLVHETAMTNDVNANLEENVATMLREQAKADREKQWLLERVVRSQRLDKELSVAIKKLSLKIKKPKEVLIQEYALCKSLNERLRRVVDTLVGDYPHLEDKLAIIANTLNIYVTEDLPQLSSEECLCEVDVDAESTGESQVHFAHLCAEKPLEYDRE